MSESKWRGEMAGYMAQTFYANDVDDVLDHDALGNLAADAILASPVLAQMKREWQAEALRDFARKWAEWVAAGAPQIRGGASYRAVCEAQEIESAEASGQEGER